MELHSPEATTRGVLQKKVFLGQKKILLFPEMRVTRKIFTRAAANLFFQSIFRRYSLFFFSFFCFFCILVVVVVVFVFFACLFVFWNFRLYGRVSDKKIFTRPISGNKTNFFFRLKNLANFTGKRLCCRVEGLQLYQKETLTQVFSCEICKIFKNTYFEEHLRTTTSASQVFFNEFRQKCSTTIYVVIRNDKRFYA